MRKLTYNLIVQLNEHLAEQKFLFRVHLKNDTTAAIDPLGTSACRGKEEILQETITNYLKQKGFVTTFSTEGLSFTVIEKRIEVVTAIIQEEDNIFATQRGYGEFKDGWEFPGGKMEPGETPQEALVREIREELDAEISVGELVDTVEYDYPNFHLTMHCFLCTIQSGDLVLKEHEAAKWLTKDTLDSVDWLPADKGLIEKLKRRL